MSKQLGVVSLPTTILISLLLILILTSLLNLMASELRQSSDADQSVRAFFAAESGIELGALKVRNGIVTGNQDCNAPGASFAVGQAQVTCQRITLQTNDLTRHLDSNRAYEIVLPSSVSFDDVKISWNMHGQDAAVPFANQPPPPQLAPPKFPNSNGQAWGYPAVLEISAVDFSASFSGNSCPTAQSLVPAANAMCVGRSVVIPVNGSGSTSAYTTYNPANGTLSSWPVLPSKQYAKCSPNISGQFDCALDIPWGGATQAGHTRIIRIVPRYNSTTINLVFKKSGIVQTVPTQEAEIDVTAKSGDVYRRIVATVPFQKNALASGLDYILFSNNPINANCEVNLGAIVGSGCF